VLRLSATDGALPNSDDVTVTVVAANQPPMVNAGPDQAVTLPAVATLDGTVTDDGLPNPPGAVTVAWSRLSGPGTVTFGNAAAIDTTASFSAPGTHVLRLSATDGAIQASDDVTVTVTGAPPPPSGGLVAAYAFNEGTGNTTADASGNGNTGTRVGPTWAAGRFGSALSFDGADDFVSVADSASVDATGALTLEAWINPRTLSSYRMIVNKTTNGQPSNYYLATVGQGLGFGFYTAGWQDHVAGGVTLQPNTWYHVAAVYSDAANSVRLYVNGNEVFSGVETNSLTANSNTLRMGIGFPNEVFDGLIDEVRIYNRALTPAEIQADMNTPVGLPP
jgi:hypothetical protein